MMFHFYKSFVCMPQWQLVVSEYATRAFFGDLIAVLTFFEVTAGRVARMPS
jgi:hypothetical protein